MIKLVCIYEALTRPRREKNYVCDEGKTLSLTRICYFPKVADGDLSIQRICVVGADEYISPHCLFLSLLQIGTEIS